MHERDCDCLSCAGIRRTIENLIWVAVWLSVVAWLWLHDGCAALGYR